MEIPVQTGRKQDGTFLPGSSGNPSGRPKGARSRLQEDFLKALADDFDKNGVAAISDMRDKDPAAYIKIIASLMPKQVELNETLDVIGDAELIDVIAALRSAITAQSAGSGAKQARAGKQAQELSPLH